ncbi:MAG: CbbQ/NirQ/NorQ/GpvN family protein [Spirochaetales bacterium]|nr:CbbQ/NirQ/NorQ/GpvN family protein [Spirochaetales bacterium]
MKNFQDYRILQEPFYLPIGDEVEVFERAWAEQIPLLLKGPTGCGKTRFVEFMVYNLGQKLIKMTKDKDGGASGKNASTGVGCLYTVACHEDLTARDLTGRYIMKGGEAVWIDGPAAMAVRQGAVLYLDEVVEARKDVTTIIHPLTDHRRILPLEALGIQLKASPSFMVVISYNPGYQSIRKNLKPSTKQRFVALNFTYPPYEKEVIIIRKEGDVSKEIAEKLVLLGSDIRNINTIDLEEGVSTRGLIHAAKLIKRGIHPKRACSLAIAQTVTDEREEIAAIEIIIDKIFRS